MADFRLPDLGEGVTEGEVGRWFVREGDTVGVDDPLVEVITDKATAEIPSPFAGVVTTIHVQEGAVVRVGTVLVTVEERASEAGRPDAVKAMPPVRKRAAALGVDLTEIRGTGPGGRVLLEDVEARAAASTPPQASAQRPEGGAGEGRREPLRGIRRTIAERMLASHLAIPAVTHVEECDVTELDDARRSRNDRLPDGPKLTYLPFVVKAAATALPRHQALNASLDEEASEIVHHDDCHIGIAVDTPEGLLVPVVRHADRKDVLAIAAEIEALAAAARSGGLKPSELRGATFTISSPGAYAGIVATPIINQPQTGILGVHKAADRPVVREGQIVIRRMMNLSITFDHRVLDGLAAAKFLLDVIDLLEHPAALNG